MERLNYCWIQLISNYYLSFDKFWINFLMYLPLEFGFLENRRFIPSTDNKIVSPEISDFNV